MIQSPLRRAGRLALAAVLLGACARGADRDSSADAESAFRGVTLPTPMARPTFSLTSTDGRPFDFARETGGTLTLLTFGYTHCPPSFSEELVRIPILATTPPKGIVLDPFAGSGTSLRFAKAHGFRSIGIDIKKEYCKVMRESIMSISI